jgi:hypothetical protein
MPKDSAPVFVKIHNYKEVLDLMDVLKHKVGEAKETLGRLHEIKSEEDTELEECAKDIDDVNRKLIYLDKTLFQPEI